MANYIISNSTDNLILDVNGIEDYLMENYDYRKINKQLSDSNKDPIDFKTALKKEGFSLNPIKKYTDKIGINETEVASINIEGKYLVFNLKNSKQKRVDI